MYRLKYSEEWELKQYNNQANMVYLGSIILTSIILLILIMFKQVFLSILTIFCLFVAVISYLINKKKKHALASWIFILGITLNAIAHFLTLGLESGFIFYVFNISGLIIFTKWKDSTKHTLIVIEVAIFLIVALYLFKEGPVTPIGTKLHQNWYLFYFSINLVMNIVGVSNSANFYVKISKNAYKKIVDLAANDALTGLPNRNSFQYRFDDFVKKQTHGIGILMLDVDNFKQINDQFGHTVGDEILIKIGKILGDFESENCFPARIGGEEFIVLITTNKAQEVYTYAENIREKIEKFNFGLKFKVTISVGAVYRPNNLKNEINLISEADNLLYRAKRDGKNRVKFKKFTVMDVS